MSETIINTNAKEEETLNDVDPDDLEKLTDEELLSTLKKLEQEKELLAQQQLLKEIEKLQTELRHHEQQRAEKRKSISETAETADEWIDDLPIEELSERLEELKRQREELSNKKLLDEIEALQNDIQRLQVDTDHKETRMIARDAVAVYALSPTEIEVRWDSSEFGEVESYRVFHKRLTEEDSLYQTTTLQGDAISCIIPKLSANTAYHIKMEADGKDRSEIKTDVVEVTTYKPVRGFVLVIANYREFKLKALEELHGTLQDVEELKASFESIDFEVAIETNLTGAQMVDSIQSYRRKLDESGVDCFILVLASYKYHGYIFGIDGGVLMNTILDCLKFNSDIDNDLAGMKHRIVLIDTVKIKEETIEELDDSYQARNVKIRYINMSKIEVSFRPPKLSENQVLRFTVALRDTEKTKMKNLEVSHTADSYFCEFSKLKLDTEYKFEIFAVYPESNGHSIHGTIKTYSKDANRPRLFGVELISQSQIYAFWKAYIHEHAENISYKVYLKELSSEDYETTTVSYPCHIFENLQQNTTYNIKVTTIKFENNNIEESEPVEITITTPKDGTPIIMADSTTAYILGEPNFLIATANGAFVSNETPSFLKCFKQHLEKKYNRYDIGSIIQDVRNELIYTSERYDMPIMASTLHKTVFLGGHSK